MIKIKKVKVDGITLYAPEEYRPPAITPDCCGPGKGVVELAIPETFWGLRISAACHIHDYSWDVAEREDFTFTNFLFLANLLILIFHGSSKLMYWPRSYRAMTYFNFVQTVGRSVFDQLKHEQAVKETIQSKYRKEAEVLESMHRY